MLQFLSLERVTKIERQALSLRAVLTVPAPIFFARLVARTTRVLAELVVILILGVASQAIGLDIIRSQVLRVSRTTPQLSPVAQISRVPLPVLLVGNVQIGYMLSSLGKIRKILLMWLLVHYRSFICVFMLC